MLDVLEVPVKGLLEELRHRPLGLELELVERSDLVVAQPGRVEHRWPPSGRGFLLPAFRDDEREGELAGC